ncbi:A/G-specific adenine glycosylase [Syntrophotalea acetylenivorans]|uniref:Adenine DNA glycosylase n=1 Tax=Syntrophotalea acetylenivorans TaxID=1842532 RepID=A0A1L3GRD4_9BACT|nr:A/G-specific adenine glycosylase [Syntrophotalea acetylenivorans]APG28487.1 A/G-specific adenine glycosylase [Syntrophotalea acetylenivorans]
MNDNPPFAAEEVAVHLLAWYGHCGRDLPWRRTRDPYCIWLSEIMLQQTGVTTVIPYYERFLQRFANVSALAAASVDEVIELWAGLGYYSRARNLYEAACRVVAERGGRFPDDLQGLMALPGVGRSTAGAILSIAFDKKAPILDGNVRRVLIRLYAIDEPPRATAVEKILWQRAEELTSAERPHDYAQAIMDLGATVCTPRNPDCSVCPLVGLCQAYCLGMVEKLPRRQPRKSVPLVRQVALLLERNGEFLVSKRPLQGMLAGLWEFPCREFKEGREADAVAAELLAGLALSGQLVELGQVRHAYSHFRLEVAVYRVAVEGGLPDGLVSEGQPEVWLPMAELAELALHGAHKKVRALLASPE